MLLARDDLGLARAVGAAALLALVAAACLLRHRKEARAAVVALPLALALVPALPWTMAAIVAGLGLVGASLSVAAHGRSLAIACAVLAAATAATGAAALALRALVDAGTPALWAPVAALVLLPIVALSTRRFLTEAPA